MKTACIAIILLLSVLVRVKVLTNLGKSMDGKSLDVVTEKLIHLKSLFPDIFAEGKIDLQRLKEILGEEVFVQNEHYELSWAGKSDARKEIQKQTTATLTPDRSGSVNFGSTQNVFIEGENLEVLRVLQKSYFGKIKMIYIDPPYNTGNDSFVYPDDYSERRDEYQKRTGIIDENGFLNKQDLWQKNNKDNGRFHSVWLSMMYPRLYLTRNLLREDGVIFISIDDNEASNLKLICDEVFGEENFIGQIIWKNATDNNPTNIAIEHEYLIVYSKSKSVISNEWKSSVSDSKNILIEIGNELIKKNKTLESLQRDYAVWFKENKRFLGQLDRYKYIDFGGVYTGSQSVHNPGKEGYRYDIIHPDTGKPCKQPLMGYRFPKETMDNMLADGSILFGKNENKIIELKVYAKDFQDKLSSLTEIDGRLGSYDIRELFQDSTKLFNNPKPVELLKNLFSFVLNSKDIILDFFAGSGTTAQAVMELNEEDGGNRQFICVQMPEVLEENSEAHKAGYKTISDITKARISKVIEKITTERASKLELETRQPLGFNAYKLAPSNFKIWRSDIQGKDTILEQLEVFQSSEKSDSPQENMFTELFLKTGLGLGVKYFQEQSFYKVGNLWICFEKFQPEMKEQILQGNVQKVIFLNSCFASDAELSNLQLELKENEINLAII